MTELVLNGTALFGHGSSHLSGVTTHTCHTLHWQTHGNKYQSGSLRWTWRDDQLFTQSTPETLKHFLRVAPPPLPLQRTTLCRACCPRKSTRWDASHYFTTKARPNTAAKAVTHISLTSCSKNQPNLPPKVGIKRLH